METILDPKLVNSTRGTVQIHPYVQGRLRALPRQDETSGILLGTSDNGVTCVTGFKRATPSALRQTASEAGPALAGFYRLQTANSPALLPEEDVLWRDAQPAGHSLFLLIKAVNGGVEATAWTRDGAGPPVVETVPLDGEFVERQTAGLPSLPAFRLASLAPSTVARRLLLFASVGVIAAMAVVFWRPDNAPPPPGLSLDLQSHAGELTAAWKQETTPAQKVQFATMSILDGGNERTMDLSRNYTSQGRITIRPASPDVIVTLRVQYANMPLLSRSATYVGFVPISSPVAPLPAREVLPVSAPVVADPEIAALRRRNREMEKDVAALRKQLTVSKTDAGNLDALGTEIASLRKRNRELESSVAVMREQMTLSKAGAENAAGHNPEIDALRKRNKELEDAVTALRKHMAPKEPVPFKRVRFLGIFKR